jgi:phosphoserine phosphatase
MLAPLDSPALSPIPPGGFACHLVSDLDGTWIPAPSRMEGLRRLEAFLAENPGITLTFATGRGLDSALALLGAWVRRLPQHLITDVGCALHHRQPRGGWAEDRDYAAWVQDRWDPALPGRLEEAGLPAGVRAQPGLSSPRRLALELAGDAQLPASAGQLRATLERLGLRAEVLASADRCLDVLPPGVSKATAVLHLEQNRELPMPLVACGDSENDLSLWQLADVPVLMADSALSRDQPGLDWDRLIRPASPGPQGILEVLRRLKAAGQAP